MLLFSIDRILWQIFWRIRDNCNKSLFQILIFWPLVNGVSFILFQCVGFCLFGLIIFNWYPFSCSSHVCYPGCKQYWIQLYNWARLMEKGDITSNISSISMNKNLIEDKSFTTRVACINHTISQLRGTSTRYSSYIQSHIQSGFKTQTLQLKQLELSGTFFFF